MAAEWWFYHVENTSLDAAIAPLIEKCLDRKWRVLIVAQDETLGRLNRHLWTYRDDAFVPHDLVGNDPARQPVLLSREPVALNGARVALLLDGADADAAAFDRMLVVFDGADESVRGKARMQFKAALDAGAVARYFQQDSDGAWAEKTPARKS